LKLSRRFASGLLVLLLVLLLVGTQMPGAWREAALNSAGLPGVVGKVAHFVLFAAMALLARVAPLRRPGGQVVAAALGLALLTEGLQFFAIDREPSWRDVGIDMAGAGVGLLLARWGRRG
jgi:VanZ family protein